VRHHQKVWQTKHGFLTAFGENSSGRCPVVSTPGGDIVTAKY